MSQVDAAVEYTEQKSRNGTPIGGKARNYFVVNVISNIVYMALTTAAMIWYIPFLINHVGVAAYGMIPLANSLIMYVSTITDGLNIAINRFLAIDLNRGDPVVANRTFNTALYISLIGVACMLPLGLAVTWLFPIFFQVPAGLENQTRLLFGGVILTFLLTIIDSNFAVSTMALHRFDLRNLVRGLPMITRMGTVIVLFALLPAQIWFVGLGFTLSAIVSFSGNWWLWNKLTPQLQMRLRLADRGRLGEMLGLSGWAIVNRIGMLLFLSTDLAVVNIYLGPKMTGLYGSLLLFPDLLRNLVDTVTSVLNPIITARYAVQDFDGMKKVAMRAVKFMGIALALPVGLLCGFAKPILGRWLGSDFQNLNVLLISLVGYLSIVLATLPLSYVLTSYNKIRIQGTVTLALGIMNLALSVIFAQIPGWGAIGIAASTAIVLTIRGVFFLPAYSAIVMKLRWWIFYPPLVAGAVGSLLVSLLSYGITMVLWPRNLLNLGLLSIAVSVGYGMIAYLLALNAEEKRFVLGLLDQPLRKVLQKSKKTGSYLP